MEERGEESKGKGREKKGERRGGGGKGEKYDDDEERDKELSGRDGKIWKELKKEGMRRGKR